MSTRLKLNADVFKIALQRTRELYQTNARVIVAFSGGKDSGVCLELARLACKIERNEPVEVFCLDDEIMYPGTFEYQERMAQHRDIKMHWCIANEPMPCVWNREMPYWWVFDNKLDPDQWVRKPPAYAKYVNDIDLYRIVSPILFPPKFGEKLYVIIGNRADESRTRLLSIHSSQSFVTRPSAVGTYKAYPIYDWSTSDVWKAVHDNKWDYNEAYDTLLKMGMKPNKQRIAPPTMAYFGMASLAIAAKAWPRWFDLVNTRIPGAKTVAHYGMRAVQPLRRSGENWEDCYQRECIENSPEWIRERAILSKEYMLTHHAAHSNKPFPQNEPCKMCGNLKGSWEGIAKILYTGDPYSLKADFLPYVQPSKFRPEDARKWEKNPEGFR
jgi:predicted phosphoadenosine phosphosulfate sulfurtransferase